MTMTEPRNLCNSLWDIASVVWSVFDCQFCTVPPGLHCSGLRLVSFFFPLTLLSGASGKKNRLLSGPRSSSWTATWVGRRHLFVLRVSRFALAACRLAVIHLRCQVWSNQLVLFGSMLWAGTLEWCELLATAGEVTTATRSFPGFSFCFHSAHFPVCWIVSICPRSSEEWRGGPNGMALSTVLDILYFDWSAVYSCNCLFSD